MNKLTFSGIAAFVVCVTTLMGAITPAHLSIKSQDGTVDVSDYWTRDLKNEKSYSIKLVVRHHWYTADDSGEDYTTTETIYPNYWFYESYNLDGDSFSEQVIVSEEALPGTPTLSPADQIGISGFRVNWAATVNASSYRLDVSNSSDFSSFVPGCQDINVGSALSYSLSSLTNGTLYYYRVRAVNSQGSVGYNSSVTSTRTLYTSPVAPTFSSGAVSAGANQISLSWNSVANAVNYLVDVSTSSSFTTYQGVFQKYSVSQPTILINGLDTNVMYYFRVFAQNPAGTSPASEVKSAVTNLGPPSVPQLSPALVLGDSSITLVWSGSVNASNYRVSVSTDSQIATCLLGYDALPVGNTTRWTVTGLQSGTTYYYRIAAVNGNGISNSAIGNATTIANGPVSYLLTVTGWTSASYWDSAAECWYYVSLRDYYNYTTRPIQVTYTEAHTFSDQTYGTNSTSTKASRININGSFRESSTTYDCQDEDGNSWQETDSITFVSQTVLPPDQIPNTPVCLDASGVTNSSFTANCSQVAGASGYLFTISRDSNIANAFANMSSTSPSVVVSNLERNTAYYYKVVAYNPAGQSGSSNAIGVTTTNVVPGTPILLSPDSVAATGFTARWYRSVNATGYRIDVATNASFSPILPTWQNYLVPGGGSAESFAITGLTTNQIHYVRIRSENSSGASASTEAVVCTPMSAAPPAPALQAETGVTPTTCTLHWGAVSGASGYRLDVAVDAAFANCFPGMQNLLLGRVTSYSCSLAPGLTYYYRLRTINGNLVSTNSATGQFSLPERGQYLTATTYSSWDDESGYGWRQMYVNQTQYYINVTFSYGNSTGEEGVAVDGSFEEYDYYTYSEGSSCKIITNQYIAGSDAAPPSTPSNLTCLAAGPTYATLQWNASTDNVGVVGYWIYRNGSTTPFASVSSTIFNDETLSPSTTYTYSVKALDAAGNLSSASAVVSVTTMANQSTDRDGDGIPDAIETTLQTNADTAGQRDTTGQLKLQILRPTP